MKKILTIIVLLSLTFFIIWSYKLIFGKPFSFNHAVERSTIEVLLKNPELLSYIGVIDNTILDFHSYKLTDVSPGQQNAIIHIIKKNQELLASYNRDSLSYQEQLTYDIVLWYFKTILQSEKFPYHALQQMSLYPLNQVFGIQNEIISFMVHTHRIINKKSAKNYINRVTKFDEKIQQLISSIDFREKHKAMPPRFVLAKTIKTMQGFITTPPEINILFSHFSEKIKTVKDIDPREKNMLEQDLLQVIRTRVYPAYEKLIAYCLDLHRKSTDDAGLWKLPNGDNYYRYLLRYHTTSDLSPDQIHAVGLKETARIKKAMAAILIKQGFFDSDVIAAAKRLSNDKKFHYPHSQDSKKLIIKDYQNIIDSSLGRLAAIINVMPKQKVIVEPIPQFKEKTAPGAYYHPPSLDATRPGIFFVNLSSIDQVVRYKMNTLAHHEAIPGHHLQIALAQSIKNVPTFRKVFHFTAYIEGWALYAEKLASEFNFYDDPLINLGRLEAELFRAVRLVVDTGIHYKRWSREQAIAFMLANTAMSKSDIIVEIERYAVMPGQACSYKIGMLTFLELRKKARSQLGKKFDIKKFHDLVLQNGSMPLSILERVVEDYLRNK